MADPKTIIRRVAEEVLSQGNLDVIDELLTDDFVEHESLPGMPEGRDGLRALTEMFRAAFPDVKVEPIAIAVDGDEVWMQARATGTHQGEFNGIPPTGKKVDFVMWDRALVRDGKLAEHWGLMDDLTMMTQLGVIPEHP